MPRHGMDDVRLTFLQDIFEAVSSASILPPENARPPGFLCRQPCQLSKLVNLLCRSIFFRPPPSAPSLMRQAEEGNQPDRKHGQNKKKAAVASVGHDLRTRAVPRRRGEQAAGERAEHTKHPLYNSGRSAAPQTTLLAERSASLSCLAKGYAHGETAS